MTLGNARLLKNDFVIIGSGASLTDDQVNHVKGKAEVIVINDNYKKAPWADILYYCDNQWFEWHKEEVRKFKGIRATLNDGEAHWIFKQGEETGLSICPHTLNTGKNSGYQAINLALLLGAENIYLLGYDMKRTSGLKHWFGDHPISGFDIFHDMIECFRTIPDANQKHFGANIWNCTPDSALNMFPRLSIYEAIR